ncbi:MAG: di-trans,poly-cis-decaprenylcistransferase [Clostridia bacterium]|nr:di-trans,poly-cis-decaprenylcistransferase [Clostridia bacterium]MBR7111856.1 di-trans,poly-cis-decaprenylcistransferase [Clostridia bacterium]
MSEVFVPEGIMPRHIAFIMDGNGRWAQRRGLPREQGHRFGVKAFRNVLEHCDKLGLEATTFYAFSTENWKRPKREVNAIMKLMDAYLSECEQKIDEYAFRIVFLGDKGVFDEKRRARMERLEARTSNRSRIVNIALNYGGRDEIVNACNRLLADGKETITAEDFKAVLYTASSPEVDMIVRTGGDLRISNFLLWQAAYAELYFTDVLWPDFGPDEVDRAIVEFSKRKRRFGGV